MPVQFTCSRCRRTLSVSQRKAGSIVACPKCGEPNVVPQPVGAAGEQPATVVPPASTVAPPTPAGPFPVGEVKIETTIGATSTANRSFLPEAGAFDDIPALISEPIATPATVAAPPPIVPTPPPLAGRSPSATADIGGFVPPPITARQPVARRARKQDGTVLLITRQAVYAQAGLVAGLVLLAFIAGLLIGRGSRPAAKVAAPSAAAEPVALDGHVLYALSPGASLPDAAAIIIALPADKKPAHKIAARGLRAGDDDDLDASPSAEALRTIGAAVVRSNDSGQFELVVQRPGDYSLLIISHHASRPEGSTIALADAEELSQYFASPKELIGQQRYALIAMRLAGAPPAFTHEFGPTDKQ